MEQDSQFSAYRQRLLEALREHPLRRRFETPDTLQVFANRVCVGTLNCDGGDAALAVNQGRPIREIEIRSAAGLLLGACCMPDVGLKTAQFSVGPDLIEIHVQNRADGGAARIAYRTAAPFRRWARGFAVAMRRSVGRLRYGGSAEAVVPAACRGPAGGWPKAVAVAQGVLALAAVFLVVDRLVDRPGSDVRVAQTASQVDHVRFQSSAFEQALAQQHHLLAAVSQAQEAAMRTIKAQEREITQAQRTMKELVRVQKELSSQVTAVAQRMDALNDETKAQIKLLARELEQGVAQQVVAAAAATASQESNKSRSGKIMETASAQPGSQPQTAEAQREAASSPFTFWVFFQEDTPEKSIDELIRNIHGRRGPINAGWHNVEVMLQQTQTPDGFVDSLKKAKIVKAVTTSLNTAPAQQP